MTESQPESSIPWNCCIFEILKTYHFLFSSSSSILPVIMLSHSCNSCSLTSLDCPSHWLFSSTYLPSELSSISMHFSVCLNIFMNFLSLIFQEKKPQIRYLSSLCLPWSDKYCWGEKIKSHNRELKVYCQLDLVKVHNVTVIYYSTLLFSLALHKEYWRFSANFSNVSPISAPRGHLVQSRQPRPHCWDREMVLSAT